MWPPLPCFLALLASSATVGLELTQELAAIQAATQTALESGLDKALQVGQSMS